MDPTPVDIAIIGAGMAGLAAARRANELALSYVVLEASDRIGGRARSVPLANGGWWEAGAAGLTQPPINSLLAECERLGVSLVRSWEPLEATWVNGELLSNSVIDAVHALIDDADSLLRELSREDEDVEFADLLEPGNPLRDLAMALLQCQLFTNPATVSALDRLAHGTFEGIVNLSEPLEDLLRILFNRIDVRFNAPVRVIDAGGDLVRLDIDGALVEARSTVVTVSTGVLASGSIQFVPELDARHCHAIELLPMTQVRTAVLVPSHLIEIDGGGTRHWFDDLCGAMNITVRPNARNQITCVTTGELLGQNPDLFIPAVVAETTGVAEFDQFELMDWTTEEFIRGGWSIARPSTASQRQVLAEPFGEKIWFAGEATSSTASGTMHGAMQSGIDAVTSIAISLGVLSHDAGIGDTDPIFRMPF